MKIVFIQAGLGAGGAEKNIAFLARHLSDAGHDVHVLAMNTPKDGAYFSFPEQVTLHVMPADTKTRVPRILRSFLFIRQSLHHLAPDLAISFLTKINVLTVLAQPFRSFPVVVSERNNPLLQKNNFLWRHLNQVALRLSDRIVLLTHQAKAEMPAALRNKADVVYVPCVPWEQFHYRNTGQKRVIAVGRLDRQKGFDLLLQAFKTVLTEHPDATLTIFGEGKERRALETLVEELSLGASVRMPGVTEKNGAWVEHGDVFVFSSRHEGFGNALAEATVAGLPSISFDCAFGPNEIIDDGETGLLVPAEDIQALGNTIIKLLDDPDLQQSLSVSARERNTRRFDPETILSQWEKVFDRATLRD
ncbi:MAG: glycosyltransferase family 4 protein [Dinoroseobacter sp.]|nr:glycosyltransferase family 4 protein [Dinoroseobacter sp.]